MSETESKIGKLIPVVIMGNLTNTIKEIFQLHGKAHCFKENLEDYPLHEQLQDSFYKQYDIINGVLYRIEAKDVSEQDIYEASRNPDGSISFMVQFYNGGCCLSEALETAIDRMEKQKIKAR